jgi:hypothetical protein
MKAFDSISYSSTIDSDFFVSELTSDSEDSQTGAKLTLDQRRKRHEEKRKVEAKDARAAIARL